MADLDTRSKRTSCVHLLKPALTAPVTPDGTISAADRLHLAWLYSGIAVAAVTLAPRIQARRGAATISESQTYLVPVAARGAGLITSKSE